MSDIDHANLSRRAQILRMVSDAGYVSTAELCRSLFISEPTCRRELSALEAEGLIRRCRGGALGLSGGIRQPLSYRRAVHHDLKQRIGRKAASLVRDGEVLFIDTSTTAIAMLEHLRSRQGLSVITNSLPVVEAISTLSTPANPIACKCTGGDLRLGSMGLTGSAAERYVSLIRADWFFFSTPCLSDTGRISDYSEPETNLRRVMLENARQSVCLCDSSKFGLEATFTLTYANQVSYVISDAPLPETIDRTNVRFLLAE